MPEMEDLTPTLETARRAARAGGAILRSYFGQVLKVQEKRDADLLTEADSAAEATILAVLQTDRPEFGVVSEERGTVSGTAAYTWLVDPLDGTNNFVVGIPQVGVSIALLRGDEPVLAVVYQPMVEVLWEAQRGAGAQRNGITFRVASAGNPLRTVVAYVQGYSVGDELAVNVSDALRGRTKRILTNWAPALDWCLLAEGKIDALVSLDSEREDQLAGTLIAQEAGVHVTGLSGEPYGPQATRILAAGDSVVHDTMRRLLVGVAGERSH